MKKLFFTSLFAVLIRTGFLVAQDNYQVTGSREQGTNSNQTTELVQNNSRIALPLRNDTIPISNLLSFTSLLDVTPKLMMNPSLEEETKTLAKALGVLGKGAVDAKGVMVGGESGGIGAVGAMRSNVDSTISSSNVLRLRGGGPKKTQQFQPKGALKSTGESSEEGESGSDPDASADEDVCDMIYTNIKDYIRTTGMADVAIDLDKEKQQATKELKKQQALALSRTHDETRSVGTVDSEWIQDALYKTAQMKLGATLKKEQADLHSLHSPHSPSSKDQELAAKKKMTLLLHGNSQLAVEKAQRAKEAAENNLKKEDKGHQKILVNQYATPLDQENSSLNMICQEALVTYATADHEFKKAKRDIEEAQLATVNAELALQEAQHIESDLSSLNKAVSALELAREEEENLEQKTDPIANEASARNSWCEALKKAFETAVAANDLRAKIPSLSLFSSSLSSQATKWNKILQEAQATEQAWKEVVDACRSALDKKPIRKSKIIWDKDLEEAVNQQMLWETRIIWFKIGQTVEEAKASSGLQNSEELLQQAEEMSSIYDDLLGTLQRKQNETPARLQTWWNHDLQQIEAQRGTHEKEVAKLRAAEAQRKIEVEKARLAAELNEAIRNSDTVWNHALELSHQVNTSKVSADRTRTENAYQEVMRLADNASAAWVQAAEGKRNVLSKTTDTNQRATLNNKIQEATSKRTEYTQLAKTALANAQEIAKKMAEAREAERIAKEKADALAAKELSEAMNIARIAWNHAVDLSSQTDTAKSSADRIQTENAYQEVKGLAENAIIIWTEAEMAQKNVLSKTTDVNQKAALNSKIQEAINKKKEYAQLTAIVVKEIQKKEEAEKARLAAELNETIRNADVAWNDALELSRQVDAAKASADRIQTENAYQEVKRLAENAATAWVKAEEGKRNVLSKTAGANQRATVSSKIQEATNKRTEYTQLSKQALANAQEIARKVAAAREVERIAKEKEAAQVAKELSEAINIACAVWNHAIDLSSRTDAAKASADRTQAENAYQEVRRLAEDVAAAWMKAEETLRNVLSKTTDMNQKAVLNNKIQETANKKIEYTRFATTALANAQEATRKAAEMKAQAKAEKKRLQEEAKAAQEREIAAQLARERAEWLEKQKGVKTEVERRIGEIRERIDLIERKKTEATETNRLAWEKVERVNNKWMVRDSTRTTAKEAAESATADLERIKEEQKIVEADLARCQEVIRRWDNSPKENVAEVIRKFQEAQSKVQTTIGDNSSCWQEVAMSLEKSADYWKRAFEFQTNQTALAVDYSMIAVESEQAAEYSKRAAEVYATLDEDTEDNRKGNRWKHAGQSAQYSADCRMKGIEAGRLGKQANVQEYATAAGKLQHASILCVQAVLDGHMLWKEGPMLQWRRGRFLQAEGISEKYRLQGVEAQEAEKTQLAAGYREATATSQRAADQWKSSADRTVAIKFMEGCGEEEEGNSLQKKADYQAKASEAQEAGKITLAAGYREAVATSQSAADQCKQSVQTEHAGKKHEAMCWVWVGDSLQKKAGYQAKATEAQQVGKTILAAAYREAAAISQSAADQWKLLAQTKASEKEDEDDVIDTLVGGNGRPLQQKADYQAKACEAEEIGKTQLAASYREAAALSQRVVDLRRQLAQALIAKDVSECIRLEKEACNAGDEADAIVKGKES
ncbi:MAG TPA: hypothetical protein VJK54_11650 [Chthoniobacterales bacterium]|nr:hypothetical protein [Chthoniobacterales bacterium]